MTSDTQYPITRPHIYTDGLSPKAVLAFLFPALAAIAAAAASWIISGEFNDNEIRAAVGGLILSGISALGAYIGHPGDLQHLDPGIASDSQVVPVLEQQGVGSDLPGKSLSSNRPSDSSPLGP